MKKLSTSDWTSSILGLVGVDSRPRSKDRVITKCGGCGRERSVVFAELVRSANAQSKHTTSVLCPACYSALPSRRAEASAKSKAALPRIIAGASERSKALWANEEYRLKMTGRKHAKESRDRMSEAVRTKFREAEYAEKVVVARRRNWDDPEYRLKHSWTRDDFVARAVQVHGDLYDYSEVEYNGFKHKVAIRCSKHGLFHQLPGHHIHFRNGCPACSYERTSSGPESEIGGWLSGLGFDVSRNDCSVLGGLEIDLYLPTKRVGIEYNGCYWHSYGCRESPQQRYKHHYKTTLATRAGIRLLQFTDVEWINRNDIVRSMILARLGVSVRVPARKCETVELDDAEAAAFFDANHLDGHRCAAACNGLVHDGRLVAAASFSRSGCGWELIRMASLIGHTVVGGVSKLMRSWPGRPIFTYANRRYANAAGYLSSGFTLLGVTPPGYSYFKNGTLYSRHRFQKAKLAVALENFDPELSEAANMFANGYRRLWDAGHFRLELR